MILYFHTPRMKVWAGIGPNVFPGIGPKPETRDRVGFGEGVLVGPRERATIFLQGPGRVPEEAERGEAEMEKIRLPWTSERGFCSQLENPVVGRTLIKYDRDVLGDLKWWPHNDLPRPSTFAVDND